MQKDPNASKGPALIKKSRGPREPEGSGQRFKESDEQAEANFFDGPKVSKPVASKPRQLRVVQTGKRSLDGLQQVSAPTIKSSSSTMAAPSLVAKKKDLKNFGPVWDEDLSEVKSTFFAPPPESGYPQPQQPPPVFEEAPKRSSSKGNDSIETISLGGKPFMPQAQRRFPKNTEIRSEESGHNFFSVGYNDTGAASRPPPRLLPYVPRGPEHVCKTYGHIFKLLNDPHLKKKVPKQRLSVHVSMPRLPAAGSAIVGGSTGYEDEEGSMPGAMFGSKSSPGLLTGGAAGSSSRDVRGGSDGFEPERVQLPPVATATA